MKRNIKRVFVTTLVLLLLLCTVAMATPSALKRGETYSISQHGDNNGIFTAIGEVTTARITGLKTMAPAYIDVHVYEKAYPSGTVNKHEYSTNSYASPGTLVSSGNIVRLWMDASVYYYHSGTIGTDTFYQYVYQFVN